MFAEYSPFFTSGLLSPPSSPAPSLRSCQSSWILGPRRGSLPTDSPTLPSSDDASLFYFTLQPKRDKDQFRSFLSLDLAESRSLRSIRQSEREPSSPVDLPIPDSPSVFPPSPSHFRNSPSTSHRPLPSPKPAPASPLPSVPGLYTPPLTPATDAPVLRVPVVQAVPQRKPSIASQATRASATTSTVSTRYRRKRRSKALACLEGRRPVVPSGDFMSLSEDEEEEEDEPVSPPNTEDILDLSLSDDQLIMLIARLEDGDVNSAPTPPPITTRSSSWTSGTRSSEGKRRRGKKSGVLKSFMDFHNDDDSSPFGWRSFIEIAT